MPKFSFSPAHHEWLADGHTRDQGADGELILYRHELTAVRATELQRVLRLAALRTGWREACALVSADPEVDESGPFDPVSLAWRDGGLKLDLLHIRPRPLDDGDLPRHIGSLIAPLLDQFKAEARVEESYRVGSVLEIGIEIQISMPIRAKTVADLVALGDDVLRVCDAFASGQPTRATVGDLIRGGGAHLLIGQPEGNWLDVKSQEYDLSKLHGEISLAQAVTRFCNGEDGGVIVIGADAKKVPGGEVIRSVRGVETAPGVAARYRRIVDRRVYPPPFGLRVDIVEAAGPRSLIVIDIPPQPEEMKPFLVFGAIRADGRTEGTFISIVQRRGEESIPITAPMIHAQLAAGRALLRGQFPRPTGRGE